MSWPPVLALWPAGVALALSLVATPVVAWAARRLGAVARPRADRYHQRPTALLGGIAIFVGFAGAILTSGRTPSGSLSLVLFGATGMFALGLVDDLLSLRPWMKLLGQVVVAAMFASRGPRLVYTFMPGLDAAITVFWLVGITNALNLLDNLDGLAAGVTVIAAAFLTYFFAQSGLRAEAVVCLSLAGAALGFLAYNFSPASIFMGDAGSLLLGFTLASVTLFNQSHRTRNLLATLAVPLLVLLVPILDTTLVTFARRAHGRAVSQGGTDHISHRLVALGFSDRSTVLVVYGVAVSSGLVALLVRQLSVVMSIAVVVLFLAALVTGLLVLIRVRVYGASTSRRGVAWPGVDGQAPVDEAPSDSAPVGVGGSETPPIGWRRWLVRAPVLLGAFDLLAIVFCYYLAFLLRFGDHLVPFLRPFVHSLPVVAPVQLVLLWASGVYRTLWHRGSAWDIARLAGSVIVAVAASVAAATLLFRFELLSRAAFAIDAMLLFLALLFGRYAGRATQLLSLQQDRLQDRRGLLLGAGAAGDAAARELRESGRWRMRPVGFLDDDPAKQGRRIRGMPVLGPLLLLEELAKSLDVDVVVLCVRGLAPEKEEALVRQARRAGCQSYRFRLELEPLDGSLEEETVRETSSREIQTESTPDQEGTP